MKSIKTYKQKLKKIGNPYLILTNHQHENVYTDKQLTRYRDRYQNFLALAIYLSIPLLFLFAENKG